MPVVGYEQVDVDDMLEALTDVLKGLTDQPFEYNSLWKAKDLIAGMQAEGMFLYEQEESTTATLDGTWETLDEN